MAKSSSERFLENLIAVWLKPTNDDIQKSVDKIRHIINIVHIFHDEQSFIDYVVDIIDERILLIVTQDISETTTELIGQLSKIDSIYFYGTNEQKHPFRSIRKFKGCANNMESLTQLLLSNIRRADSDNIGFYPVLDLSLLSKNDMNKQEASFMYSLLLKDIFLEMKDDSKDEMISFCREQYADNSSALQFINEFERGYRSNRAIHWYTRESFLYKILNKALRTQTIDTLYKIRGFIRDLHFHLLECYEKNRNNSMKRKLYRGQYMLNEEFSKIQNNKGGLLSIANFFSTTENESLATVYAGISGDDETAVVFEITAEPSSSELTSPFANVEQFSNFGESEQEWLFSFGCVFRIIDIKQGVNNQPWTIHLLLTNEFDPQLKMMIEHFRSDIYLGSLLPVHSLGKVAYKMGMYASAISFYETALHSESAQRGKIMILKETGQAYESLALYDRALAIFHQALIIHEKLVEKHTNDYHRLAAIYVSLAGIYGVKQDKDRSLNYLNEAITTELNLEQANREILLNCYNDIGTVYFIDKQYDKALYNYQKALDTSHEIYPETHPNTGTIHMNIANVYCELKRYESALESMKKSLDIQLSSLPVDHPDIAKLFNNISSIYHAMGQYEESLKYCKDSLKIYLKRMPEHHPNLSVLYNNLTELCNKLGYLNESLEYQYKKLNIYLATLTSDDTKIGIAYNNIAATLAALHRFDEAKEYALKSFEFTTRVFGPDHPATKTCGKNLQDILNLN